MNIKIQKLEDLAEDLVPEHFAQNAPQFYELVKAFLQNIENVQKSINSNFLDTIDYKKIKNTDFKKVYLETYLAMFNLDDANNTESLGDLLKVSKLLGTMKGTQLLFKILLRLLSFVMPTLGNTYNQLLLEYQNETDPIQKAELEKQLNELKLESLQTGKIIYSEYYDENGDLIPFKYKITADIAKDVYEKYIRSFAHPSGWMDEFIFAYINIIADNIEVLKCSFTIFDMFTYPFIQADGQVTAYSYIDPEYPHKYYQPAELGLEADYSTIASKLTDPSKLYIDNGKVYYKWNEITGTTIINGEINNYIDANMTLLANTKFRPTAGGYAADTTEVGPANGCLTAGNGYLCYQIIANNKDK